MRIKSSLLVSLGAMSLISLTAQAQTVADASLSSESVKPTLVSADAASTPKISLATSGTAEASAVPEAINAPIVRPIDAMSRAAAVYGTYQGDVSTVRNKPFASAKDIESATLNLGGQDADQLSKGWLAYSALVASQSDEFRDAVRELASYYGRDRVLLGLRNDYTYVQSLAGSEEAVDAAATALGNDSDRIKFAASYVQEQAYSLQASGWAKRKVGARKQSILSSLGTGRSVDGDLLATLASEEGDTALNLAGKSGAPSMWEGVQAAAKTIRFPTLTGGSIGGDSAKRSLAREDLAHRINTLAAYRLLGVEGESASQLQTALADRSSKRCLVKAQLNLQQCVAAVHNQYELPFCISEHALTEVKTCMDKIVE